jgi:hypothetical protein
VVFGLLAEMEPGFGLGTRAHRATSQWRIDVSSPCLPTAQAFLPETALTLKREVAYVGVSPARTHAR